jgi:hypothetical protein
MPIPSVAFPHRPHATVTLDDIDRAIRKESSHCMIADALRREYPKATRIVVDIRTIRMTDPLRHKRFTWLTPYEAARFLVRWDQGIKPPEFVLRLKTPIGIREAGDTSRVSRKGKERVRGVTPDGTVLGGKALPLGFLAGKAAERSRPPKPNRVRGFGIDAMSERPDL